MAAKSLWRDGTLDAIIRATCRACVDQHNGNFRAAAAALGISHTRLYRIVGVPVRRTILGHEART